MIAWAKRNERVQTLNNQESFRYVQPLLKHLQKLFSFMTTVTTSKREATSLIPLVFDAQSDLIKSNPAGEITRDASAFSVLLVLVSLLVVIAAQVKGRSVMIICYLAGVLGDLKSYFRWGLPRICRRWHEAFGLVEAKHNKYDFD